MNLYLVRNLMGNPVLADWANIGVDPFRESGEVPFTIAIIAF